MTILTKLVVTLVDYLEMIINIFSNALIQTFLVYTTVVLIYKFFIEEQTANYIPTFVAQILNKVNKTYTEIDYLRNNYQHLKKDNLVEKYENAKKEAKIIHHANHEHNKEIIGKALTWSIFILSAFILLALLTSKLSVNIHWYQLLLSAFITIVGTSYEYFFITQIIVKYNYIKLTNLYDIMADKVEELSDKIVSGGMVSKLEEIVKDNGGALSFNNVVSSISEYASHAKDALGDLSNQHGDKLDQLLKGNENKGGNNINEGGNNVNKGDHNGNEGDHNGNEGGNGNIGIISGNGINDLVKKGYGIASEHISQNNVNHLVNQIGQGLMSDLELNQNNNGGGNNSGGNVDFNVLVKRAGIMLNDLDHSALKGV